MSQLGISLSISYSPVAAALWKIFRTVWLIPRDRIWCSPCENIPENPDIIVLGRNRRNRKFCVLYIDRNTPFIYNHMYVMYAGLLLTYT